MPNFFPRAPIMTALRADSFKRVAYFAENNLSLLLDSPRPPPRIRSYEEIAQNQQPPRKETRNVRSENDNKQRTEWRETTHFFTEIL